MRRVKEAIVVEGKHDAIRVRAAVEAVVVPTNGFRIFRNPERVELLRQLGERCGLIILTDSDSAGMVIRNHLLGAIPGVSLKHAYVPPIPGKERRKATASAEGLLGVEGVDTTLVLKALERAGATFEDESTPVTGSLQITKADLMEVGLSGCPDSAEKRLRLLEAMRLPRNLSVNRLLEVINRTLTAEEWRSILVNIERDE